MLNLTKKQQISSRHPNKKQGKKDHFFVRWFRRSLVGAGLLCVLAYFHTFWLSAFANLLIVHQQFERAERAIILDSAGRFDLTAQLYHNEKVQSILIVPAEPGRLVRLGILPAGEELVIRELRQRGVPQSALHRASKHTSKSRGTLDVVAEWLQEHPKEDIVAVCDQFHSRRWLWSWQEAAQKKKIDPQRLQFLSLPPDDFSVENWWLSKQGLLSVAENSLRVVHLLFYGVRQPDWNECDPNKIPLPSRPATGG